MAIEFDKSRPSLPNPVRTVKPAGPGAGPAAGTQSPTEAGGTGGDAVTLTGVSSRIRDLVAEAGKEPPVDEQRVADLRAAITEGRYGVDSRRLADKLLHAERELFP